MIKHILNPKRRAGIRIISLVLSLSIFLSTPGISLAATHTVKSSNTFLSSAQKTINSSISAIKNILPLAKPDEDNPNKPDNPGKPDDKGSGERQEQIELRTKSSKTYLEPDGSYSSEVSIDPIHYKAKDDKFEEIDNTLINSKRSGYLYQNKANDYYVYFKKKAASAPLMAVSHLGKEVYLSPTYATTIGGPKKQEKVRNVSIRKKGSSVSYKSAYPNTDIKYTVDNQKIKEEIVINKYTKKNVFIFKLSTKGMTPKLEDGEISLYDKNNERLLYFERPYAYDSKEAFSDKIELSLAKKNKTYEIKLTVDNKWLKNKARKYPVTIDPTLTKQPGPTDGKDTFVSSANPDTNYDTSVNLKSGYGSTYKTTRSYLYFDLPPAPNGTIVQGTSLQIYASSSQAESTILTKQITKTWDSTQVTWNKQPTVQSSTQRTVMCIS